MERVFWKKNLGLDIWIEEIFMIIFLLIPEIWINSLCMNSVFSLYFRLPRQFYHPYSSYRKFVNSL